MSLKTFLTKIWASVKALFPNLPTEIQTAARVGVVITENIKNFVDSPAADILTALIPGDLDNHIKTWLRAKLPVILTDLRLIVATNPITDPAELTTTAVTIIQNMSGNIKNAFLHDLGILIAQEVVKAQDKELPWSDGVYLLEWYYQHKYKSAE